MTNLLRRWSEIRTALRRFPWLDYVQASMLVGWGFASLVWPTSVVNRSHFGSLRECIALAGAIALLAGLAQLCVAYGRSVRGRMVVGFVGLWVMVSLWFSVDSVTGKIAWGGHAVLELLICLALVP